jgi:hypothetical protein
MAYPSEDERVVYAGTWGSIEFAVCSGDSMPAHEFLLGELNESELRKLSVLFERLANSPDGKLRNREQFKKVAGSIFEFKRFQIRVGCFQLERVWYLTHGFRKKQDNWPSQQLDRANRIRDEHVRGLKRRVDEQGENSRE